jgi:glutamine synthetase adenylyltransferase
VGDAKQAEREIHNIKTQLPQAPELAGNIVKMRDKLAGEIAAGRKAGLNLKKRPGGFLDIEFLAILKWAELHTDKACHDSARPADPLAVLKTCQDQMHDAELAACIQAVAELEDIQAFSQICLPRYADTPTEEAPSAAYQALAETSGYADFNALLKAIEKGSICIEKSLSACLKSC